MTRLLVFTLLGFMLSACTHMQDRPTEERMDHWFSKPRYVIEFESEKTPSELINGLKNSDCQGGTRLASGVAPAGPVFIPVSAQVRFQADYGSDSEGMEWASMNIDSRQQHDSVMAVRAFPREGGSRVIVTPVRGGVDAEIQASLESGSLFCEWRDFVNQWRM